jgi:hypothetical protein
VRVRVKRTAKGLSYDIEDAQGERAISIQNQAGLNAISLALLFAQAEERVRTGHAAWIVLDDPAQSLDREHERGLARAIEELAARAPVIVGTTPGTLEAELAGAGPAGVGRAIPRRVIRLAPRGTGRGVAIESEELRHAAGAGGAP